MGALLIVAHLLPLFTPLHATPRPSRAPQRTRVIPESLDPDWDEVFAFGQKVHLEDAAFLRVKVKDYDTPLKSGGYPPCRRG